MVEKDHQRKSVDRRTILKSAGVAAGAVTGMSGVEIVEANNDELYVGETMLVEAAVEHRGVDESRYPVGVNCHVSHGHVIDRKNNRVTLTSPERTYSMGGTRLSLPQKDTRTVRVLGCLTQNRRVVLLSTPTGQAR